MQLALHWISLQASGWRIHKIFSRYFSNLDTIHSMETKTCVIRCRCIAKTWTPLDVARLCSRPNTMSQYSTTLEPSLSHDPFPDSTDAMSLTRQRSNCLDTQSHEDGKPVICSGQCKIFDRTVLCIYYIYICIWMVPAGGRQPSQHPPSPPAQQSNTIYMIPLCRVHYLYTPTHRTIIYIYRYTYDVYIYIYIHTSISYIYIYRYT